MKGKNIFSQSEVDAIKDLINEKVKAPKDKQKGIRDKIRKLGFYYSDFSSRKDGYTVKDFENLIYFGTIQVIGGGGTSGKPAVRKKAPTAERKSAQIEVVVAGIEINELLSELAKNRFDPAEDLPHEIPDQPGNYLICLKKGKKLPAMPGQPKFIKFKGLNVLYTGIAGGSLRKRDYRQHFTGNNAGRSTLRKSLGVIHGFKQVPRDKDPNSGKTKFGNTDEIKLTNWMRDNLLMYFIPNSDYIVVEEELIRHFNPPLNLQGNHSMTNLEFRRWLSLGRSRK